MISVGNLTMGGTGKTPCVLRLAELLKARGRQPGILTRGYGRSSPQKQLALAPGAAVSAEHSGDEPQIFVRSGPGAGGHRGGPLRSRPSCCCRDSTWTCCCSTTASSTPRLARNVDIVLIDALEPVRAAAACSRWGGCASRSAALARAEIVLITRSGFSDLAAAIERDGAPMEPARARLPRGGAAAWPGWSSARGVESRLGARPFERAGVFCGLGNPQAFRRTLARMGVEPVDWVEFEDHHSYRPGELRRLARQFLARGATALVTTEKDAINLCEAWPEMVAPMRLYWLKAAMRIDREEEFVREIVKRLG